MEHPMRRDKNPSPKHVIVATKTYMDFTFDPAKEAANRVRHEGLSLAFGAAIFEDADHIVLPSIRLIDGEDRYKAIGMVEGKLFTAVHVIRDSTVRFISVRRSNNGEERIYRSP
jgi:uncharacterized DUF497 family protein